MGLGPCSTGSPATRCRPAWPGSGPPRSPAWVSSTTSPATTPPRTPPSTSTPPPSTEPTASPWSWCGHSTATSAGPARRHVERHCARAAGARRGGDISASMERATSEVKRRGELLWEPSPDPVERATMTRYMGWLAAERGRSFDGYGALWEWSVTELEEFWASIWDFFEVEASASYSDVLPERVMPGARWFEGAE